MVEGDERRSSRKRPVVDYRDDKPLDHFIKEQEEKEAKKSRSSAGGGGKFFHVSKKHMDNVDVSFILA